MPSPARRVVLSAAAIVILFLIAGLMLWPTGGGDVEAPEDTAVSPTAHSPVPPKKRINDTGSESETQDDARELTPVSDPPEADEEEPASDNAQITLRMVDTDGEPVPLVQFEYAVLAFTELRDGPFTSLVSGARLDGSGEWRTTVPRESARRAFLLVRTSGDTWRCVRPKGAYLANRQLPTDANAAVFPLAREPEQLLTLTLLRVEPCTLVIEYEDGQPFEGKVSLSWFRSPDGHRELAWRWTRIGYEPSMSFPVIESTQLGVGGESARPRFEARFSAAPTTEELRSGLLRIVIAADESRVDPCGLILVHTGLEPDQSVDVILVTVRGGSTGSRMRLKGPGETKTTHLRHGPITCIAIGDGLLWSSGLVNLKPGEWRRVQVEPQAPAQVTLTVKNESGEPLSGAVVSAVEVGGVDWRSPTTRDALPAGGHEPSLKPGLSGVEFALARNRMSRGKTDAQGRLRLHTWPGSRKFYVEAKGYESRVIECTLRPGGLRDHGEVRLERADASVTVRIIAGENGQLSEFVTRLNGLSEGAMKSSTYSFEEGDEILVENIPAGRYQVWVRKSNDGGRLRWKVIELERREHKEVVIDVTRDYGLQED